MDIKTVTLSSKGQIVLPREVRERLGLKQGDRVDFVLDEQGIHLRPNRDDENPFLKWVGITAGPLEGGEESTEDFIHAVRHADMTEEELRVFRSGPGAQVYRVLPDGTRERL